MKQIGVGVHRKENKGMYVLLFFILLVISFLEYWLVPGWSKSLLEILVNKQMGEDLGYVLIGMLITGVGLGVFGLLNGWCSLTIRKKVSIGMEKAFIEKCSRLESFGDENRLSLLRQTLPQAGEREVNWLGTFLKTMFGVLFASAFVIAANWKFLILTYGVSIIFILISWMRQKKVKELAGIYEEKSNRLYAAIWEHIYNREVTPFLNGDSTLNNFQKSREIFLQSLLKLKKAGNLPQSIAMLGSGALMAVSLLYGGYLYLKGQMSMGDVYAVTIMVPVLSNVLLQFPAQIVDFQILKGTYQLVDEFMQQPEYIETDKQEMAEEIEKIEMKIDAIGYPQKPEVLKNIRFCVNRGEFAVLTGTSGCGKSTLIRNVAALEKGYTGEILLNEISLDKVNRKSYWKQIDYLGQNPGVTSGSVRHNIILHKEFDEKRYFEAVEEAGLSKEMAEKETLATLSSGELQKVCFARIFYQNKNIWLLDEATSAMDDASEQHIVEVLQRKRQEGKLIFTISHREAFVKAASRRFEVTEGTVVGV